MLQFVILCGSTSDTSLIGAVFNKICRINFDLYTFPGHFLNHRRQIRAIPIVFRQRDRLQFGECVLDVLVRDFREIVTVQSQCLQRCERSEDIKVDVFQRVVRNVQIRQVR
jgi:hypothetical protein